MPYRYFLGPSLSTLVLIILSLSPLVSSSFLAPAQLHLTPSPRLKDGSVALWSQKNPPPEEGSERKEKRGYQFGDISRSFARKFTSSVNDLTGKDDYELGDLSRWIDGRVKDKVNAVTGKDSYTFGDLSRWADAKAKDKAMEFTNKTDYQAGDVSKEIIRRVRSGDYTVEDILLLCRILVTMGVSLSPVAASLPGKLLVEMLDISLVQELGGRLVGAITLELDRRMKQAVTGDASYELGDMTKKAFLKFIDKDEYKFGDITKTVLGRIEEEEKSETTSKPKTFAESAGSKEVEKIQRDEKEIVDVLDLDPKILEELLDWDKAMIQHEVKTDKN